LVDGQVLVCCCLLLWDYVLFVCVCAVDAAKGLFGAVDGFVVGAFVDLAVTMGTGLEQNFKRSCMDFSKVSEEVAAQCLTGGG